MRKKIVLLLSICISICLTAFAVAASRPDLQSIGLEPQVSLDLKRAEIAEPEAEINIVKEEPISTVSEKQMIEAEEPVKEDIKVEKKYIPDVEFNSLPKGENVNKSEISLSVDAEKRLIIMKLLCEIFKKYTRIRGLLEMDESTVEPHIMMKEIIDPQYCVTAATVSVAKEIEELKTKFAKKERALNEVIKELLTYKS